MVPADLTWRRWALATALSLLICAVLTAGVALFVRGPVVSMQADMMARMDISEDHLEETVRFLTVELGPRWFTDTGTLSRAASWIEQRLRDARLQVEVQDYSIAGDVYRNVIAVRKGTDPEAEVVIIGAHYDAFGGFPGADDNASGVAVLLELATTLPEALPRRNQIFAFFATEEPPLFASADMGSAHFARRLLDDGVDVHLMVALDLVGYFSDEPGSQRFPLIGLGWIYPNTGNFIAVVGDMGAGRWIRTVKRGFLTADALPVVSFRAPSFLPGVNWSDHISFRRLGLPGVLVTDTAFLRNPNYHQATDTIDTLDFRRMSRIVAGLHGVLHVADSPE